MGGAISFRCRQSFLQHLCCCNDVVSNSSFFGSFSDSSSNFKVDEGDGDGEIVFTNGLERYSWITGGDFNVEESKKKLA